MKHRWKRALALALTGALLLGAPGGLETAAAAAEGVGALYAAATTRAYTPEDGTYTLEISDGTITRFTVLEGFDGHLVIPEDAAVTAIGKNAFVGENSLLSVHIPDSVLSIGEDAFYSCDYLAQITGGAGIVRIDSGAFQNCYALRSVPEFVKLTQMGSNVFEQTVLTSFTVPAGLTVIPSETFHTVKTLKSVVIHENVTEIQSGAFHSAGLETMVLPDTVTTLGNSVFENCTQLTNVTLPQGLANMGSRMFASCKSLTSIEIPDGITAIPEDTFYSCSALTSVTLPDTVTSIGAGAFYLCKSLTEITLPEHLTSLQNRAFGSCSALREVDLPEGITVIEGNTFAGCASLERVYIPSGVKKILGSAFFQCTKLDNVTLPQGLEVLEKNAFSECRSLRQITVPGGVREIGSHVFGGCDSLTSVTLQEGLTILGNSMFSQCWNLEQVNIPSTITAIPDSAFYRCAKLESIDFPESVKSIGSGVFYECSALKSVTIFGMDVTIDDGTFNGTPSALVLYCYPDSTAEAYAKEHSMSFEYISTQAETYTMTAQVLDPEGQAVESGFTVHWYGEDGITPAGTGAALSGVQTGGVYVCEVALDEELSQQFESPRRQTVTVGEADETLTFQLVAREAIPQITVTGQVTDQAGAPLSGAEITLTGAGGNVLASARSGADGRFTLTGVPAQTARLRVGLEGYYSKTMDLPLEEAGESGSYAAPAVALYETVSDRITLAVTRRYAAAAGEPSRTETLTALGGLDISLTSGGAEIPAEDYEIQGTAICFQPNAVTGGQTITVTVSDPGGGTAAASAQVTLDDRRMAQAELTLVEHGGFRLGSAALPGQSNMLVFDGAGAFRAVYTVRTGLESGPMEAGRYTLVLIQDTPMLQSVPDLSMLDQLGLESGTDYVRAEVTIADGVLTDAGDVTVPALAEDAFSYLTYGGLLASTAQPALGMQMTFTANFTLEEAYQAQQIQVHLPDNLELLAGSVTLDNQVSPYIYQNGVLTVSVPDRTAATLRFSAAATDTGAGRAAAYVRLAGGALQPLGTTVLTVSPLKLILPERTAQAQVVAAGKTVPGSAVILYDNGTEVARTTANAAGSWTCDLPLAGPLYERSYHFIQAEVRHDRLEPLRSEEVAVTYDETSSTLTTITMYNPNHITGESATVMDFTKPMTVTPSYYYWPGHMDYTFKVEFDDNAERLDAVTVVTVGGNGETVRIPASYDPESDAWVAVYNGYTQYNTPVSVGVEYQGNGEGALNVSPQAFLDSAGEFEDAVAQAAECTELVYAGNEDGETPDNALVYRFAEADLERNTLTMEVLLPGEGGDQVLCRYTIQRGEDRRTAEELEADGYNLIPDAGVYVKFTSDQTRMRTEYVNAAEHTCLSETYQLGGAGRQNLRSMAAYGADEEPIDAWELYQVFAEYTIERLSEIPVYGEFASATQNIIQTGSQQYNWRRQINGNYRALRGYLNSVGTALTATCPDGSFKVNAALYPGLLQSWKDLNAEIEDYKKNGTLMINACLGLPVLEDIITGLVTKIVSGIGYGELDEWLDSQITDGGQEAIDAMMEYKDNIKEILGEKAQLEGAMAEVEALLDTGSLTDYITSKVLSEFVTESPDGDIIDVHFGTWSAKFYTEQGVENYINTGFKEYYERIEDLRLAILRNYEDCGGGGGGGGGGSGGGGGGGGGSGSGSGGSGTMGTGDGSGSGSGSSSGFEQRELRPIFDPSGYVYEAVPSNRLEDVKATVYYQDENGDAIQWDAADYDQTNPQITGTDGAYAWFVPEGQWKVRFTKDGYLPADSSGVAAAAGNAENEGWLPVPPPQFEVNVAMVSTAAPAVEGVTAYTDRIEVAFSQYMDLESVESAIVLTRDGEPVSAEVTALDAEYNLEGTVRYATRFAVTPADGDCTGTLTVAAGVKNYAGTPLEQDSVTALSAPVQRPAAITADELTLVLHRSARLSFALVDGAAGTSLTVESLTPSLLNVSEGSVVTDANGAAAVTLTGSLPGVGRVRVTEPVSGLSGTFDVTVVMTEEDLPVEVKPEPVTAALSDGTAVTTGMTVEQGAQITLSTATAGAAIRYTLNDTCPCTEDALTYADPITITADTVLRAAAVLDGVYSDTIRLELTVKSEQPGGGGTGGGSTGGGEDIGDDDTPLEPAPNEPFTDISGHWAEEAILSAVEAGLFTGTSETTFSPDVTLSRAMFTTVLWRAAGSPKAEGTSAFADVAEGAWYHDAVVWSAENGVVQGVAQGVFAPDDQITREQMAAMLYRYAQAAGEATDSIQPLTGFADQASVSAWAADAMAWAVDNGYLTGKPGDLLDPQGMASRAEAAVILLRFLDQ